MTPAHLIRCYRSEICFCSSLSYNFVFLSGNFAFIRCFLCVLVFVKNRSFSSDTFAFCPLLSVSFCFLSCYIVFNPTHLLFVRCFRYDTFAFCHICYLSNLLIVKWFCILSILKCSYFCCFRLNYEIQWHIWNQYEPYSSL